MDRNVTQPDQHDGYFSHVLKTLGKLISGKDVHVIDSDDTTSTLLSCWRAGIVQCTPATKEFDFCCLQRPC
jgi:hypothetical protein